MHHGIVMVATAAVVGVGTLNLDLPIDQPGKRTTRTGTHVSLSDNLVTYRSTVRVVGNSRGAPFTTSGVLLEPSSKPVGRIDEMRFTCHGGRLRVVWTIGNLEPTKVGGALHLDLVLDNTTISSLLRGSQVREYGDQSESVHAVVSCSDGAHVLYARIDNMVGAWGMPYANTNDRVQRGFIAEEVW